MRDLKVTKLSDEFGQYTVLLTCTCGHTRRCYPRTLAALSSWDTRLDDVVKRMKCSKCGKKKCTATIIEETKPRGTFR